MGVVPGNFSRRKESQTPNPHKLDVIGGRGGILFAVAATVSLSFRLGSDPAISFA